MVLSTEAERTELGGAALGAGPEVGAGHSGAEAECVSTWDLKLKPSRAWTKVGLSEVGLAEHAFQS